METDDTKAALPSLPLRRLLAMAVSHAQTMTGIDLETPVAGVLLVALLPDKDGEPEGIVMVGDSVMVSDTVLIGMSTLEDEAFIRRTFTAVVGDCLDHGMSPEELVVYARGVLADSPRIGPNRATEGHGS